MFRPSTQHPKSGMKMTSVTMAPHAAEKHVSVQPHIFFAAPIWKPRNHVRVIRDVRHSTGPVVLEGTPVPVSAIMPFFGGDVAWSELPIIGKPRFRLRIDAGSELAMSGMTSEVASARLSMQCLIAYDEDTASVHFRPERVAYNRAVLAIYCREHHPDVPLAIRRDVDRKLFELRYADVSHDEMTAEAGGSVHLDYNYAFNGMALMKPIMAAYVKPDSGADEDKRLRNGVLAKHVADFYLRFGHSPVYRYPIYLQMIYALLDASPEERRSLYGWFIGGSEQVTLAGLYRNGFWIGTGKYEPLPAARIFESCMTALHGLGLIEILHHEEEVRLSRNAVEMMDCFHKANRDPDIVSRFATPGTWNIPLAQTDRIDSCLARFFRKFKANNGRR